LICKIAFSVIQYKKLVILNKNSRIVGFSIILFIRGCCMTALKEEVVVKEKKYFVCIYLNNEEECLVEKKKCPQDKSKNEKCKQVEDAFQ